MTKQEAFDWIREAARNKTPWSDVQAFLMKLPLRQAKSRRGGG